MAKTKITQDYQCQYEHACPHLEGLSTRWVYDEYRRKDPEQRKLWEIIEDQEEVIGDLEKRLDQSLSDNAELEARNRALHRRQFKPRSASRSAADERAASQKKNPGPSKRGAPIGHPGWFRPRPDRIDATVEVPAPEQCPNCQSTRLEPIDELDEHLQEDIVLSARTVVTQYLRHQVQCLQCGQLTAGVGENEIPKAHIGPVAKSLAIYLRHEMGLSYRKVRRLFDQLFGLKFVPASAVGFDRKAAVNARAIYQDLLDKVRASHHVHRFLWSAKACFRFWSAKACFRFWSAKACFRSSSRNLGFASGCCPSAGSKLP